MNESVKNTTSKILEVVKASNNILLHCHIFPDCDSIGSALAMKGALEQLGKKVTIIRGDSSIPEIFMKLPGAEQILQKNYFEIDLAQFDLFIILDSGSLDRISQVKEVVFPEGLKTINIDHHVSNIKYARDINLVADTYPATALILFDLFKEWGIQLNHDIALNLFMGTYTDTGGFRYESTTPETFLAVAELVKNAPDYSKFIFLMDNSRNPSELRFQGVALSNIETFLGGFLAITTVSFEELQKLGIQDISVNGGMIASTIKSAIGWDIAVCLTETAPNDIKASFRTRDANKYDLSLITSSIGGGGHKAASGVIFKDTSLDDAKKKVVAAVEAYIKEKNII